MSHIRELQEAIRTLHGVESEHVGSAPVKEMRNGEIVWQGVVEVFALVEHPQARHAYAWSEETNDPIHPRRSVSVLHLPPIRLPGDAVKAAMAVQLQPQEYMLPSRRRCKVAVVFSSNRSSTPSGI